MVVLQYNEPKKRLETEGKPEKEQIKLWNKVDVIVSDGASYGVLYNSILILSLGRC